MSTLSRALALLGAFHVGAAAAGADDFPVGVEWRSQTSEDATIITFVNTTGKVKVFDLPSKKLRAAFDLPVGVDWRPEFKAGGKKLLLTQQGTGKVIVFDLLTGKEIK